MACFCNCDVAIPYWSPDTYTDRHLLRNEHNFCSCVFVFLVRFNLWFFSEHLNISTGHKHTYTLTHTKVCHSTELCFFVYFGFWTYMSHVHTNNACLFNQNTNHQCPGNDPRKDRLYMILIRLYKDASRNAPSNANLCGLTNDTLCSIFLESEFGD